VIEVKNLYKSFGKNDEIKVLRGIDYTINQGEKIVIIGPSGGGKSTFLRCLNMLEVPTDGEIFFEGEKINSSKCNINKVREKMGMVFQHFNLFPHKTILDNITLAPIKLKLKTKEQAIAAIAMN
jgi:polar amino acid transport system ATP-binding protein